MLNALAPSLEYRYGDCIVLWYSQSNTYSVVDTNFKTVLDSFIAAPTVEAFFKTFKNLTTETADIIAKQLEDYLTSCQIEQDSPSQRQPKFNRAYRKLSKYYSIADKHITVYSNEEQVLSAVHPSLMHYEVSNSQISNAIFDIYLEDGYLNLFFNETLVIAVPQQQYHYIQGKFHFEVSNLIHEQTEAHWLGTIHGSTITDEKSAILFIGSSGSGKSTLSSLLVANGYKLLADDISMLGKETGHIYYNPSGISVKQKAFKTLESVFPDLKTLPEIVINKFKGHIKYLSCPRPEQLHYPCDTMVLVNYIPNSKTLLAPISVKDALETFIPDSWIHPGRAHANSFLKWLENLRFYELRYSDTESMVKTVAELFKTSKATQK